MNNKRNILEQERSFFDKDKLLTQIKEISEIIVKVSRELQSENYNGDFVNRINTLVTLGEGYLKYLEKNRGQIDDHTFQQIAILAKSSFIMNIKLYVNAIQDVSSFVNSHSELNNLNHPDNSDGPWSNIKKPLYYSSNNDVRELFREKILTNIQGKEEELDINLGDLDHLERFLVDPKKRPPHVFIQEYLDNHSKEIISWNLLSIEEFQEHVLERKTKPSAMSDEDWLKQLDEELASIKVRDLKKIKVANYPDRQKKISFVRALRFNRLTFLDVEELANLRNKEITNRKNLTLLRKKLGRVLKKKLRLVVSLLDESKGQNPSDRIQIIDAALIKNQTSDNDREITISYLKKVML